MLLVSVVEGTGDHC